VKPPVLSVRNLNVSTCREGAWTTVVNGVSFEVKEGEVLAMVGESGCGKTKTAEAILGLVPRNTWNVAADAIELDGSDLASLPENDLRDIRGRDISMIFQEPLTALDPVFTAGNQLRSVFIRHRGKTRREASESSMDMLRQVGFADPGRIMKSYPHQLSGGMRQRVMIAMAMACRPRILIADEPTTALDVTTQAQVLSGLIRLGREFGTSLMLITHDLGLVAQYADRAVVMRDGEILEEAPVEALFDRPRHPYTRSLLAAASAAKTA
jgi:ABC-type dipeptide/oligopeptide/nickel transport system ATPase component